LLENGCYWVQVFSSINRSPNSSRGLGVAVTLWIPIWQVLLSSLCRDTGYRDFPTLFIQSLEANDGTVPRVGHNCFLPDPSQFLSFIILITPSCSSLHSSKSMHSLNRLTQFTHPAHPIKLLYQFIQFSRLSNSLAQFTHSSNSPISFLFNAFISLIHRTHPIQSSNSSNLLSTSSSDSLTPHSLNSLIRATHSLNRFCVTPEHTTRFKERTQETRTDLPNLTLGEG
jgi:hypothetical protein